MKHQRSIPFMKFIVYLPSEYENHRQKEQNWKRQNISRVCLQLPNKVTDGDDASSFTS